MTGEMRVPGNLLICGEYAVTEAGGLGICCAVDRFLRIHVEASDSLVVTGKVDGRSQIWDFSRDDGAMRGDIVSDVVSFVTRFIGTRPSLRIDLDSSELQGKGGRKLGLGSSAAVSVALTRILLDGAPPGRPDKNVAPDRLALEAHRFAQGGAGSGYDVYTSFHEETGLFIGGREPKWVTTTVPLPEELTLFFGAHPISSRAAVEAYVAWKQKEPDEAAQFLTKSNGLVARLASSVDKSDMIDSLYRYRELQLELGRAINVPADMTYPGTAFYKAVGAGNELGIALESEVPAGAERIGRMLSAKEPSRHDER